MKLVITFIIFIIIYFNKNNYENFYVNKYDDFIDFKKVKNINITNEKPSNYTYILPKKTPDNLYINPKEVSLILDKFVHYINNIQSKYVFYIFEVDKINLTLSTNNNQFIKKYQIFSYVFEKNTSSTKNMIINFTLKNNMTFIDNVILTSDEIFIDNTIRPKKFQNYIINNTSNDVLITKKDIEIEKKRRKKNISDVNTYSCFGSSQQNITNKLQCIDSGGVWDKPSSNSQCPFFNSNKNYTNNRGSANIAGYCDMPSGVSIIGYSHYDNDPNKYKPQCYNCKTDLIGQGTVGNCCENQKFDKLNYPTLITPDYKFPGDHLQRLNAKLQLQEKNLSIT